MKKLGFLFIFIFPPILQAQEKGDTLINEYFFGDTIRFTEPKIVLHSNLPPDVWVEDTLEEYKGFVLNWNYACHLVFKNEKGWIFYEVPMSWPFVISSAKFDQAVGCTSDKSQLLVFKTRSQDGRSNIMDGGFSEEMEGIFIFDLTRKKFLLCSATRYRHYEWGNIFEGEITYDGNGNIEQEPTGMADTLQAGGFDFKVTGSGIEVTTLQMIVKDDLSYGEFIPVRKQKFIRKKDYYLAEK